MLLASTWFLAFRHQGLGGRNEWLSGYFQKTTDMNACQDDKNANQETIFLYLFNTYNSDGCECPLVTF